MGVPYAAVRISERHSPERTPRRITASTRCPSAAEAKRKPHQALAAYVSLATTAHRKTVCVSSWHMPCARSVLIACTDCAHEPTIFCTWSLTDSLSDMVTPSIFIVVTRVMPGSSGAGVSCRLCLVVKTISTDLLRFNVKLLASAYASTLFTSLDLVSTLLAGAMSDLVEVWRSYNKNNFACFFWDTVYKNVSRHGTYFTSNFAVLTCQVANI